MTTIRLSAFPQTQTDDVLEVDGYEPWNLKSILDATKAKPKAPLVKLLEAADRLRDRGPSSLSEEERAFWYAFQVAAKSPLVDADADADPGVIDTHLKLLDDVEPDVAGLKEAMEKVESNLVSRFWNIGFFTARGPTRLTALPDWCMGAVTVNMKAKTWDLVVATKVPAFHIRRWAPACIGGKWFGNRQHIRQAGLPAIRDLYMGMGGLVAIIRDNRTEA